MTRHSFTTQTPFFFLHRDYVKSIVFGGLDGIITTFAVVASVTGAPCSPNLQLAQQLGLACLAGNLQGAKCVTGVTLGIVIRKEHSAAVDRALTLRFAMYFHRLFGMSRRRSGLRGTCRQHCCFAGPNSDI